MVYLCVILGILVGILVWRVWGLQREIGAFEGRFAAEREEKVAVLEWLDEGIVLLDAEKRAFFLNRPARSFLQVSCLRGDKRLGELSQVAGSRVVVGCEKLLEAIEPSGRMVSRTVDVSEEHAYDIKGFYHDHLSLYVLMIKNRLSEEKAVEMGRQFVANASHELRTPITIVKGFAETMRDVPELTESMFEGILETILRNCERMERLVKNLLVLADLDSATHLKMQKCDLVALMDNCCQTLISLFPDAKIETFTSNEGINIKANPDLLDLAILNLLTNAAKYSGDEKNIQVIIEEKPEHIAMTIRDFGRGIELEDLNQLFERFFTVNKTLSRKMGGAGLGLSIVKSVIDKHHAQISVDSKVGGGTCFTILFPSMMQQLSVGSSC
ncbi:MAG: Adaptive-response sensory-kinase SasA [Chlamydiia bacterium]|nr:Adaptive-response sensory-kinase SasA [Chlamydiia bacterium]